VKKTILLSAALVLSVMTAPAALAQDDAPSCAEAQLAFTKAQAELDVALAADKAAAAAKAADEALERAERRLEDAREAALSGGVPLDSQTAGDAARLRTELAELLDIPVAERTTEQQARIDQIEDRLPLIDAVVKANTELVAARAAASTDADRLADVAAQTDAAALATVREDARKAADKACGGVTTTPPTPTAPADVDCGDVSDSEAQRLLDADPVAHGDLDADKDGIACEDELPLGGNPVVTPSGGVATGGGPA
jgi:hypothetical protein